MQTVTESGEGKAQQGSENHNDILAKSYAKMDPKTLKNIVTPDAFTVDEKLYGLMLARPWRRAGAILLDLLLIAILTNQNVLFLAVVAAATFIKVGKDYQGVKRWRRTRRFMRFVAMIVLALVIYQTVSPSYDEYVAPLLSDKQLSDKQLSDKQSSEHIERNQLSEQQLAVKQQIADKVSVVKQRVNSQQESSQQSVASEVANDTTDAVAGDKIVNKGNANEQGDQPATSLTDWLTGFITTDLGFGFGWAAFYFSVFTAWWQGQTPGKRLFAIRVIQLDGTPLSLWSSFGRYGGYGAGFATGLLGFAQVYWDPNRQAIQDKISSTVVVQADLKREFKG